MLPNSDLHTHKVTEGEGEKVFHTNGNEKKAGVEILISEK